MSPLENARDCTGYTELGYLAELYRKGLIKILGPDQLWVEVLKSDIQTSGAMIVPRPRERPYSINPIKFAPSTVRDADSSDLQRTLNQLQGEIATPLKSEPIVLLSIAGQTFWLHHEGYISVKGEHYLPLPARAIIGSLAILPESLLPKVQESGLIAISNYSAIRLAGAFPGKILPGHECWTEVLFQFPERNEKEFPGDLSGRLIRGEIKPVAVVFEQ